MSYFFDIAKLPEEAEFENKIRPSKNFKIVKFGADWCGPCRDFTEQVNLLINGVDGVEYHDLKVNDKPGAAEKYLTYCYNFKIAALPRVFVLSPDNKILGDSIGEVGGLKILQDILSENGITLNEQEDKG